MLESVKTYIMTIKNHEKSLKIHENNEIMKFNCAVHTVCDPNFCCCMNENILNKYVSVVLCVYISSEKIISYRYMI